jgi:hypothetical protein
MRFRLGAMGARMLVLSATLCIGASTARAITVKIDYTYDANGFFGAGNPSGAAAGALAKSAVEAAASYFSGILHDTLALIQTPAPYVNPSSGANRSWHWTQKFDNPATGLPTTVTDAIVPANEYWIYVGARDLGGSTLGAGGKGGIETSSTGTHYPVDVAAVNTINTNFISLVTQRGEPAGTFAAWGGFIAFDRDSSWHYNHLTAPVGNDFYSVALHEIAHTFGFGTSDEWNNLAGGSLFTGSAAASAYGSAPPLATPNPTSTHWASGTMSKVYGTNVVQEAAMDPALTVGTRKYFTSLDAAALVDIGWEATPPMLNPADFNIDGVVNGTDFSIWKTAFGDTAGGDANGDSVSDGRDFLAWQKARGASTFPASLATGVAAPEPTAATLIGSALAAFHLGRRSHRHRAR